MMRATHREPALGVANGQIGFMVFVPDLSRAASQLRRAPIFAVVVAHATVAHHGRDVGEGPLAPPRGQTENNKASVSAQVLLHGRE